MKIYSRDIFLSLSLYFLVTVSGLILIAIINQINLISSLGVRSTDLYIKISKMCLYMVPHLIYFISPIAVLISTLTLLHKFRKENKIIALQSFGINPKEISRFFYIFGCVVLLIIYLISFFVTPITYSRFKSAQFDIRQQNISDMIETGVIKSYVPGLTIYIDSRDKNGTLKGIFISDMRMNGDEQTFSAQSGLLVVSQDKINLQLQNGTYYNKKQSIFLEFSTYSLLLDTIQSKIEDSKIIDPNSLSLEELLRFDDTSHQNFNKIKVTLQQKIIWPLYSLLFLFICLRFEWRFYLRDYSRSASANHTIITVLICTLATIANFILQSISFKHLLIGITMSYLVPMILLQILTRVVQFNQKI